MRQNSWRALLLVVTVLLVGALPVIAQTTEEDGLPSGADGSVLIGIQNDISLAAGEEADAVFVVQSDAVIEGSTRAIVMVDADVTISGVGASVDGIFAVGGSLTIEPGASVRDVAYADTAITGDVSGELNDIQTDLAGAVGWIAAALVIFLIFIWIGFALAMLVTALFVVAFGTSQARRAAFNIGNDILKTLVVGLLALIVPWIVISLLAVTIVGLPLAIGLAFLWGVVALLGYIVVGLWIGERILSRARMASRPYGAAFLGVLILMLLGWVPLVTPVVLWFGIGAVTLAGWRVLRGRGAPPVPPGYGQPWGQPYAVPPPPYAPPPYAPPPPPPPQGQWPPQGPPASWQ